MKIIEKIKSIGLKRVFFAIAAAALLISVLFQGAFIFVEIQKYWLMPFMKPGAPSVKVAKATVETIPLNLNYVGNVQAFSIVDMRARVEGFLLERNFVEGDDVGEGDIMYVIDPAPFQAKLDQSTANLAKNEASLAYANEQVERYRPLAQKEYVSKELFDRYVKEAGELQAAVDADKAAIEQAKLDLSYCTMYAPITGRVGRTYVNAGNLVGAGEKTKLATIVQLDPIYVYFSPSDREYLKIASHKNDENALTVNLSFTDGTKFPHQGKVDFSDNVADQKTSTVLMRAIVPNPEKILLPNVYVNVELFVTTQPDAVLIPEQALVKQQVGYKVYVVNDDDVVEDRHIKTESTYNKMAIITDGIKAGDRVVVDGVQRVKPGMVVRPE